MARLFLRKNDLTKNDKLPYFTLVLIPGEEEGPNAPWQEVGAFWKAKSGNGYTGQFSNGAALDLSQFRPYAPRTTQKLRPVPMPAQRESQDFEFPQTSTPRMPKPQKNIEYPKEEINPDEIPF